MTQPNHVDTTIESPSVLSLCSGGLLGLERGLERCVGEIRPIAYVEIEAFIDENIIQLMEKGLLVPAPVFTDVKAFAKYAHHFYNKVHCITAGYPCQPFSNAGERKGDSDPRHLFPYILRIIEAIRPVCGLFENVSGHLSLGFDEVYRSLRKVGYTVEGGIFTAAEVGAPHERERLFILAMENTYVARLRREYQGRLESEAQRTGASKRTLEDTTGIGCQRSIFAAKGLRYSNCFRSEGTGDMGNRCRCNEGGECYTNVEHSTGGRSGGIRNTGGEREGYGTTGASGIPEQPGDEMANTDSTGFEQSIGRKSGEKGFATIERIGPNDFPAPPGNFQYEWEAPRLIPSMGCTVNGYSFREDLLRILGNGVVEQTVEVAVPTLLRKIITGK